jgi:hypothetical protein
LEEVFSVLFVLGLYKEEKTLVTLKISPYTKVTLTFDFDFGLDHPVHGRYGEGALHREDRKKLSNKEIKIWSLARLGARHQDKLSDSLPVAI